MQPGTSYCEIVVDDKKGSKKDEHCSVIHDTKGLLCYKRENIVA